MSHAALRTLYDSASFRPPQGGLQNKMTVTWGVINLQASQRRCSTTAQDWLVCCLAMVRCCRGATQLGDHLVSGVSGCDSRTLDAVRRTGLLLPTLLPAASTCAGGRVSFSLRRSRARSALQLHGDGYKSVKC